MFVGARVHLTFLKTVKPRDETDFRHRLIRNTPLLREKESQFVETFDCHFGRVKKSTRQVKLTKYQSCKGIHSYLLV